MKTYLDCFPCFLKQGLECARISTDDPEIHKKVLNNIMEILISIDYTRTPPNIARRVYREIKKATANSDPYRDIRARDNEQMLALYNSISSRIFNDDDALYLACRLAAGINIIDSGAGKRKEHHTQQDIEAILDIDPVIDSFQELKNDLQQASILLYIGDNSGEIVMDKLLITVIKKEFPDLVIYFGVRGEPVINDIIEADAIEVGIDEYCEVISNGDSAPGTELAYCSAEFKRIFEKADLIISKGQGNYETLSGTENKKIYYMLVAKCPVIARHIGVDVGGMMIKRDG
ncbi:MAG: ARMT1-like domain-containing protein [Elusimicrobiota bacterium]